MTNFPTPSFLQLQMRLKEFHQSRRLGQHFLVDAALLNRIADALGSGPDSAVIEIGPGPGTLTSALAARAGAVTAVEFDQRLCPLHADAFGTFNQVRFIYEDALHVDLAGLARSRMTEAALTRAQLTGNLPFQITSPLLFAQCAPDLPWSRMVFMVQREVADRILSPPGPKDYGVLSVKLALWWRVRRLMDVAAGRFVPPPRVDATVLVFEPLPAAEQPPAEQWKGLSMLIDACFNQRRKKLVNSLTARWPTLADKDKVVAALAELGYDGNTRAEVLAPPLFRTLYERLAVPARPPENHHGD